MIKDSLQKLKREKVFRDPIHRYVRVQDQLISDLIDTKEFQRLRRIKQLGTSSTTFHGAEHSRFNHSLGVYELIRRIIDEVFENRMEWDDQERLLVLCAGLLHDIGHGPFSHSFEKVFNLDHEAFSRKIILGDSEVNHILKKVEADFPDKVAEVIEKKYKNKLVVSLISSQVDADRMDYLLRDAYYTGVSYGKFDLERMLRVIQPSENGLLIKASGIHAVEDYIMCRYQMYRQVYFHPTSGSTEVLLTNIFKRVKHLFESNYSFQVEPRHFIAIFEQRITIEDYLKLDEAVCLYYFNCWQEEADSILSDLCQRLMTRNQFQYVLFIGNDESNYRLEELRSVFKQCDIDPAYYLTINSSSNVAYDEYEPGKVTRQPVSILQSNNVEAELSTQSKIIAAINGRKSVHKYLYYPHDMVVALGESSRRRIMALLGQK